MEPYHKSIVRGVSNHGAYALNKQNQGAYAPDEIWNSMFLPWWKMLLWGATGVSRIYFREGIEKIKVCWKKN